MKELEQLKLKLRLTEAALASEIARRQSYEAKLASIADALAPYLPKGCNCGCSESY